VKLEPLNAVVGQTFASVLLSQGRTVSQDKTCALPLSKSQGRHECLSWLTHNFWQMSYYNHRELEHLSFTAFCAVSVNQMRLNKALVFDPDGAPPSNGKAFIPVRFPPPTSSSLFGAEPGSMLAPTVRTHRPEPGEPIVASPVGLVGVGAPLLPADATTVVPASVSLSEATDAGRSGSLGDTQTQCGHL